MSDLSGSLSGGQAISGSLSGGSVLQGGLSMGGVSPAELLDKADVITDTASGSIVSIPDGMASPVLGLSVDIEPIQAGTGDPSPDNIRPISGRSEVRVRRTSVNVWDEEWRNGYYNAYGAFVSNANFLCNKNLVPVKPGATYYFKCPAVRFEILAYGKTINYLKRLNANIQNATFTVPDDCYYISFSNYGSGTVTTYNHDISINYPSTDHDYHAYQGQTVTLQLGQTVYGGTVDVTEGKLVIDRFLYVYDGTEYFSKSGTALNGFYNNLYGNVPPHNWPIMYNYTFVGTLATEICSMMIMTRNSNTYKQNYGYCYLDTGMNFNCPPSEFGTTVTSFKAKLAELYQNGTPLSVFARINTPIEVDLTAEELDILFGDNNIWADSGDTTVDYRADTKLWILKKIAQALNA